MKDEGTAMQRSSPNRLSRQPVRTILTAACLLTVGAGAATGAKAPPAAPAFTCDAARATACLEQTLSCTPTPASTELRKELAAVVDEVLDGPWAPLYCDYSASQAGGVGPAAWAFQRPGDSLLALAQAGPYMTAEQKAKALALVRALLASAAPTRQVFLAETKGKPRSIRKTPAFGKRWMSGEDTQRALFAEAYALWAAAAAFEAWDDLKPAFDDLRKLRKQLDERRDFAPAYKPGDDAPLTAATAADKEYRFNVYEGLLSGCQDNYGYHGARAAAKRMRNKAPVFFYVRYLSALTGYWRLAKHFDDGAEADWAKRTFARVAAAAVGDKSAPYLWSDPYLAPEVGRLIRDAAAGWLDELARLPNVGNLPATDWGGKVVPGKRDFRVVNPHTWYHAWGGQGEGVRPQSVMGVYLAHAYLFRTPPDKLAEFRDIPWSKADLYYLRKLVVAIQTADKAPWVPAR